MYYIYKKIMLYTSEILKVSLYIIMAGIGLFAFYILGRTLFHTFVKLEVERKYQFAKIIFMLAAVLIFVSLISYNRNDYLNESIWKLKLAEHISNKTGIVGAIISFTLFDIFGITAYIIPFIILLFGVVKRKYTNKLLLQSCFILGLSIFTIFFISLKGLEGGGIIGESLNNFFTKYLGKTGAYILAFAFLVSLLWTQRFIRKFILNIRIRGVGKQKAEARKEKAEVRKQKTEVQKPLISRPLEPSITPFDISEFNKLYLDILQTPTKTEIIEDKKEIEIGEKTLVEKFEEFGITGEITGAAPGPVITRYEFAPDPGIKLSRISALSDDIALSMKSSKIRIVAPIPGKSAVGIEVPNKQRENVYLKELLTSPSFEGISSKLGIVLGKDIAGEPISDDIAYFPHLLIAGATGSGKSVCINTLIASILYRAIPEEVRFIMIDPKRIELPVYNGIPHLITPVISDAKESLQVLKETINWMEIRYKEFARAGVRDIEGYNIKVQNAKKKPYILIIIDELADLMITAPREIEETLTRLASMSRAVGIHLVLATQRPSVDVITGLIKANFPARIAFQVASKTDSRTILDMNGAEKLLGRGDMLFIPPGKGFPMRLHGAYISTGEAKGISRLWAKRFLAEAFKDKIENSSVLASAIVEEDMIEPLIFKDSLPGGSERIGIFAQRLADRYNLPDGSQEMDKKDLLDLFYEFEYYPSIEEAEKVVEEEETEFEQKTETGELDELFNEAKDLVVRHQIASVSLLQRRFKIGYARAGRLVDQLEKEGVIGPYVGSKAREVLIGREE